jgi:hypothetical protein
MDEYTSRGAAAAGSIEATLSGVTESIGGLTSKFSNCLTVISRANGTGAVFCTYSYSRCILAIVSKEKKTMLSNVELSISIGISRKF